MRTTLYFDGLGFDDLERIAGRFGEPGRVVLVALRDGRKLAPPRTRGALVRFVQITIHPAVRTRLDALAEEHEIVWQEAMRRLTEQWVADYDAMSGGIRQAG